jgi:hypothetical protein
MTLIDWIDLSSDDDDDEPTVNEGQDAHVPCHAAQIKVETVDLTTEEDVAVGDKNAHCVLPEQEFPEAAHGGVEEAMQPGNQVFPVAGDVEKVAMQPGNEEFVAAVNCTKESMQPGNQDSVAAVDCTDEVMQPGNQVFPVAADAEKVAMQPGNQVLVAAVDCTQESMQSGNQESESAAGDVPSSCTEQGVAAGDCAEDVHSQHADDVSTCSQITEQDATSCLCMSEQDATPSSSRTQNQNHNTDALLGSPPISSATPFPRQFWKAGEYNVAAQASISSMFLTFSFKLGNLFTIPPINVTCPVQSVQSVHHGRLGGSPYLSIPLLAIVFWNLLTRSPLF